MEAAVHRLTALLNQTRTGEGLLNGATLLPITDGALTAAGIEGQVNLYYDSNDDLVFQSWNARKGEWQEVALATA